MEKQCPTCLTTFISKVSNKIYCNSKCRPEMQYGKLRDSNVDQASTGAIAELMVSADLMSMGFEVFRALSPSSSCDLIAIKNGKISRFEIRTGHEYPATGRIYWGTKNFRADYYGVFIHHNKKIIYSPELLSEPKIEPGEEKEVEVVVDKDK